MNLDFLQFGPLIEVLEGLPHFPYSVIGIVVVVLLLIVSIVVRRKRPPKRNKPPLIHVSGVAVGISSHDEFDNRYTTNMDNFGDLTAAASAVPPPFVEAEPPMTAKAPAAPVLSPVAEPSMITPSAAVSTAPPMTAKAPAAPVLSPVAEVSMVTPSEAVSTAPPMTAKAPVAPVLSPVAEVSMVMSSEAVSTAPPMTAKAPAAPILSPVAEVSMVTPSAAAPTAPPPVVRTQTAPIPPIARPSEPAKPIVDDAALEQTAKLCQGKFQGIYMQMYIELALVSNFDQFRTEVASRLRENKDIYRAVSELGMPPEGVILMQMAAVTSSFLQSGEHHTGKGQLNTKGQELLKVYRYTMDAMREKGIVSHADAQDKLDFMEKKMRELGN